MIASNILIEDSGRCILSYHAPRGPEALEIIHKFMSLLGFLSREMSSPSRVSSNSLSNMRWKIRSSTIYAICMRAWHAVVDSSGAKEA
jgi:hypothetical protein